MARDDRLFELIQILRDGQLHRAQDLAQDFGVSTRTIWRDMATLVESGLPIEGERGVGYIMKAPVSLPPLALNAQEFEALRLGLSLASSLKDKETAKAANSLRSKINAVTPATLQDPNAESLVFRSPEAERAAPFLAPLRQAQNARLIVILNYQSAWGQQREHHLRVLQIAFWGDQWTVLGWCELSHDFRMIRVDLIVNLTVTSTAFLPEPGKMIKDYLARLDGS